MLRIGRFPCADLVVGQMQVEGSDRFRQVVGLGRADDRRGHERVVQHPGKGDLLDGADNWLVVCCILANCHTYIDEAPM